MNRQVKCSKDGCIRSRGIEWTDWTWEPVTGCQHDCRWRMPDGTWAICYACVIATRLARKAYPEGFEHHYWHPKRLHDPLRLKTPSKIFISSMGDLFGSWVPEDQIHAVLEVARQAPQHVFQTLTKNAPRLRKFSPFPQNVWIGASVPPTSINRRILTLTQQEKMLRKTIDVLKSVDASVRWLSIEPLSWDLAPVLENCGLQWSVIGAASEGAKTYQPQRSWVQRLLEVLDAEGVPVFFKGNLKWLPWREEWPRRVGAGGPEQARVAFENDRRGTI